MMKTIGAIAVSLLFALSSQAAVVITVETTDLTKKDAPTEIGRISIDGKKMAMRGKDAEEVPQMIFRGDRSVLYAINPQRKEYLEVDKTTFDQMGGQMDEMMKQMEAKLADMPPQQRAMVERMMRRQMPDPTLAEQPMGKPIVKRTEERKEIAGYPCRLYEIHVDDQKVREIWVTTWTNVDQGREAFGIFSELEDFFEGLMDAMKNSPFAGALQNPFDQVSKIDGFPVLTREFKDGKATRESLFKSVTTVELAPTAFEPPKDYAKRDPAEGMKKRRPR
jgi:hypothetical protein